MKALVSDVRVSEAHARALRRSGVKRGTSNAVAAPMVASLHWAAAPMMTHSDPPSERPGRRAQRVSPGPLRIRLHRTCEGILVNISETGALVQVPLSMAPDKQITLNLEVQDALLRLPARVVRSVPQPLQTAEATLRRTEYKVALEFNDLPLDQVAALKRLIRAE